MASAPPAETVPLDGDVIEDLDGTGEEGERSQKLSGRRRRLAQRHCRRPSYSGGGAFQLGPLPSSAHFLEMKKKKPRMPTQHEHTLLH